MICFFEGEQAMHSPNSLEGASIEIVAKGMGEFKQQIETNKMKLVQARKLFKTNMELLKKKRKKFKERIVKAS